MSSYWSDLAVCAGATAIIWGAIIWHDWSRRKRPMARRRYRDAALPAPYTDDRDSITTFKRIIDRRNN